MPVYEYQCVDCNKKFDLFVPQRMNTEGVVCRQCHGANVKKLISTFARIGGGSDESFSAPEMSGGGCCGGGCGCGCSH